LEAFGRTWTSTLAYTDGGWVDARQSCCREMKEGQVSEFVIEAR
jgi:hypothetical protein